MRDRQRYAADQVVQIVGADFAGQLSMLPFVPYAAVLALSVSYRDMRRSKTSLYFARARSRLQVACDTVEELKNISWTAAVAVRLCRATLAEMDRAYGNISEKRTSKGSTPLHHASSALRSTRLVELVDVTPHEERFGNSNISLGNENFGHDLAADMVEAMGPDIWEFFHPEFDLDAIDTSLNATINLTSLSNSDLTSMDHYMDGP